VKILLVEDSERLQRSLSAGLNSYGYVVDQAYDGRSALEYAEAYEYDVIILDLMLPKVDGLTVLKILRNKHNRSYVLILSAMDQTEDRIKGLDMGADDYLVKPFSFDELVSRIQALTRRHPGYSSPEIHIGDLCIDTASRMAAFSGHPLSLTASEFSVLEYFIRNRGRVVTPNKLIDQLHDASTGITRNAIEVHIYNLRRKLKSAGAPPLIHTRRGFGYVVE
jgi:DNA-binding response OmpR family regulator